MVLGVTRIIAIDNEVRDLEGLVHGINKAGGTCLGILYTGDPATMHISRCPHVRIIFVDLNMVSNSASGDFAQHYSNIGSLLGQIGPLGPYLIVLWTQYSDRTEELRSFLNERLIDVPRPFGIAPLPKEKYLDEHGAVIDINDLAAAINGIIRESPALAALSDWEDKVISAASHTLSSVTMLGSSSKSTEEQQKDIPRLLTAMAEASAGRQNVETYPARAVSDALLPILVDHVSSSLLRGQSAAIWARALSASVGKDPLSAVETALLNGSIHIAEDAGTHQGAERGAVIPLRSAFRQHKFVNLFGIDEDDAAEKQFRWKESQRESQHAWVLVQTQAACDYAQRQPGPLPFYLGLETPSNELFGGKHKPAALWQSPLFQTSGSPRQLRVNVRFHVSLAAQKAKRVSPLYRLREQILGDLIHVVHSYGSRPGMISF